MSNHISEKASTQMHLNSFDEYTWRVSKSIKIKLNKEIKNESVDRKKENITSFSKINREGLWNGKKERFIKLYSTKSGETI